MASLEGQTLGKYRVLEPLGRGGMARVYRAYHPQLDRYVAVKVMRSDLVDDEDFLGRFGREARAIASLRHTNIVQVFDFDSHDDIYYMVMELLQGDTLKTRLNDYRQRNEKMPYGEMLRVMLDVLDGLGYAHDEGMIHRDIKPANILLTKKGQAVLADFGIAQIVGGTRHTMSGALMGTLNYMAPEGVQGTFDPRSDLYALGIVLFEMLTHTTPFEADTPLAVLMKHVNDPLPLPREFDPDIPEAFERILLKVLAKDPADRYANAAEMASALRQAARTLELDVPNVISLPLSFTTDEAPAESVAVFSGTVKEQLSDSQFASDDTTGVTDIDALKRREKSNAPTMSQYQSMGQASNSHDLDVKNEDEDKMRLMFDRLPQNLQVLLGVGAILLGNFLAIMLGGAVGTGTFSRGWPFELLLTATLLFIVGYVEKNIWMFIPAGVLLLSGWLFGYYALSGNWSYWAFLWPLAPLMVMGVVFGVIYWQNAAPPSEKQIQDMSFNLARISAITAVVMIIIGAFL